jgi:hypothetical protein
MRSEVMMLRLRRWAATIAVAIVMTYVGTVAVSEVRDVALWRANLTSLSLVALICGALLAVVSDGAAWSLIFASGLAALACAGVWTFIWWSFLGGYFSIFELIGSNLFVLQAVPRSGVIFLTSVFMGLLGIVVVTILVPYGYRSQ